jgi:hypothetical protein
MTEEDVALVIGVMDGLIEAVDLGVAGVEINDVLEEDFIACDWLSNECPAKDDAVGD